MNAQAIWSIPAEAEECSVRVFVDQDPDHTSFPYAYEENTTPPRCGSRERSRKRGLAEWSRRGIVNGVSYGASGEPLDLHPAVSPGWVCELCRLTVARSFAASTSPFSPVEATFEVWCLRNSFPVRES